MLVLCKNCCRRHQLVFFLEQYTFSVQFHKIAFFGNCNLACKVRTEHENEDCQKSKLSKLVYSYNPKHETITYRFKRYEHYIYLKPMKRFRKDSNNHRIEYSKLQILLYSIWITGWVVAI